MFCPSCRDEFRAGFTRCAQCDVDLVEELPRAPARDRVERVVPRHEPAPLVDFCGFLELAEAQDARRRLRAENFRCEIVLREGPDGESDEFWLRVEADRVMQVQALFDRHASENTSQDDFECSACGHRVAASAEACPHCGATFDED